MSEAPGPIAPSHETTIDVRGAGLYAETFLPKGSQPRGVVVVTHGYAEHCGRYREVAHVIVDAGWAAITYDCRGHGKSPGDRGYIDSFETYVSDLHAIIAAARQLVPGVPVVLLGHSHGSLITLRALAGDSPPDVKAAIVSSPYLAIKLAVPSWKKLLARVASKIAPKLAQPNGIKAEHLTDDMAKRAEHDADPMNFAIATS